MRGRPVSTGADAFVVEGYRGCAQCGVWKVEGTLRRGYCDDCLGKGAGRLELVRELDRPAPKRPSRARRTRKLTAEQQIAKRNWNKARSLALHRLARIHHPLYEVLLAEAKAELGLDPRLDQRAPGSAALERAMKHSAVG